MGFGEWEFGVASCPAGHWDVMMSVYHDFSDAFDVSFTFPGAT
jgi:hypothetical protein